MEILTESQKLLRDKNTLIALQQLVAAPEGKDLWYDIGLGLVENAGCLFFTNAGLEEIYPDHTSAIVEPSVALVRKYNLTENKLCELLIQLTRLRT